MTKEAISNFFSAVDSAKYTFDTLLEMDEVAQISLKGNGSIYPDKTLHVRFDQATEMAVLIKGYYSGDSFVTVSTVGTYPFSEIVGFLMVNPYNTKSPYSNGRSA
jgi:hypothetical protein